MSDALPVRADRGARLVPQCVRVAQKVLSYLMPLVHVCNVQREHSLVAQDFLSATHVRLDMSVLLEPPCVKHAGWADSPAHRKAFRRRQASAKYVHLEDLPGFQAPAAASCAPSESSAGRKPSIALFVRMAHSARILRWTAICARRGLGAASARQTAASVELGHGVQLDRLVVRIAPLAPLFYVQTEGAFYAHLVATASSTPHLAPCVLQEDGVLLGHLAAQYVRPACGVLQVPLIAQHVLWEPLASQSRASAQFAREGLS